MVCFFCSFMTASPKVRYLAHKLLKVPRAKWADVCNCLGGRVCACVCKTGREKRRRWQREEEEEEEEKLLGIQRTVSPVWVCFSGLTFHANVLFKGPIIWFRPVTSLALNSEHKCSLIFQQLTSKFWANHLFLPLQYTETSSAGISLWFTQTGWFILNFRGLCLTTIEEKRVQL